MFKEVEGVENYIVLPDDLRADIVDLKEICADHYLNDRLERYIEILIGVAEGKNKVFLPTDI